MKKKKILVTAAGTATAWHIVSTIKSKFESEFEVYCCDMSDEWLIPAATICDKYFKVLPINDRNYYNSMLGLLKNNNIDIFIPLIEDDAKKFYRNNPDLLKLEILSTAPSDYTTKICDDKKNLFKFLSNSKFNIPQCYTLDQLKDNDIYIVKPVRGFGSIGVEKLLGKAIKNLNENEFLIQEICQKPEVTIEIFNYNSVVKTVCRERIATKEGVCVKTRLFFDEKLQNIAENIAKKLQLPEASCTQVMKSIKTNEWLITDLNIRPAAGTALSAAVNWDLIAASLCAWGKLTVDPYSYLKSFNNERFVTRVYKEIITK